MYGITTKLLRIVAKKNDNLDGQGFHTNPERINRKGAPKKLPELQEILAASITKDDLIALANKAKQMGNKGNLRAIEWLYERIYGKAKQEIGFTDKEGNDVKLINFVLDERYKSDHGSDNPGIPT